MSARRSAPLAGILAVLALALAAMPAAASFPGANGKIVFDVTGAGDPFAELGSIDPDGANLTTLPLGHRNAFPSFSADGDTLVFSCSTRLCTANSDGTGKRTLPNNGPGEQRWPSFSASGKLLAYVSGAGTLEVANANGKQPRALPQAGSAWQPEFAARGTRIYFSKKVGKEREIYSIKANGKGLTRVSHAIKGMIDVNPTVSPDNRTVAFERHRAKGGFSARVWSVGTDGKRPRSLLQDAGTPAFSPDGEKLAHQVIGPRTEASWIAVSDVDGSNTVEITSGDERFDVLPTWQPLP